MDEKTTALVEKVKAIAIKYGKEMAKEMMVEAAFPALELAVANSETKIDDAILMALEQPMKDAVLKMLESL